MKQKTTIRDGSSTALYAAHTVNSVATVDTVNTVYTVDTVNTVDMVHTVDTLYTIEPGLHCFTLPKH